MDCWKCFDYHVHPRYYQIRKISEEDFNRNDVGVCAQTKVLGCWRWASQGSCQHQQVALYSRVSSYCYIFLHVETIHREQSLRTRSATETHCFFQIGHHDPCGCGKWKAAACSVSRFKIDLPFTGNYTCHYWHWLSCLASFCDKPGTNALMILEDWSTSELTSTFRILSEAIPRQP